MNPFELLFDAQLDIAGHPILYREIVGNLFGIASAIGGMRRKIWAWPVGIVGNLLLLTVFLNVLFATPQEKDLYGQAGRQIFFIAVSIFGWVRWRQTRSHGGAAVVPRWAGRRGWVQIIAIGAIGTTVSYFVLRAIGSFGPLPDAWIFVGSFLATYGMARGWTEFWLIWIAVDAVGVPLLWSNGFYPSAILYLVYAFFVILGFGTWVRAQRAERAEQITATAGVGTL